MAYVIFLFGHSDESFNDLAKKLKARIKIVRIHSRAATSFAALEYLGLLEKKSLKGYVPGKYFQLKC